MVEFTLASLAAIMISAIDTPTPTTAVNSGNPAASADPRVKKSTTRATTRPMASVAVTPGTSTE